MSIYLYRHFDRDGNLLYVGVSLSTISRLSQHKDASHWFAEIARVTIESFADRPLALVAEREAISKENPRHNLMRPTTKMVKQSRADQSRTDLVQRITQFNPTYSLDEAARALSVGRTAIERLIANGRIGWVQIGGRKRITGWQLIEFLEFEQVKSTQVLAHIPAHVQKPDCHEQRRSIAENKFPGKHLGANEFAANLKGSVKA